MKTVTLNGSLLSCSAFYVWITKPFVNHNSVLASIREAGPINVLQTIMKQAEFQWAVEDQAVSGKVGVSTCGTCDICLEFML